MVSLTYERSMGWSDGIRSRAAERMAEASLSTFVRAADQPFHRVTTVKAKSSEVKPPATVAHAPTMGGPLCSPNLRPHQRADAIAHSAMALTATTTTINASQLGAWLVKNAKRAIYS